MTPTHKRRLLRLAKLLDTVPRERFSMSGWSNGPITKKRPCGTTACAAGWATTIPEFRMEGLRLYRLFDHQDLFYRQRTADEAAELFFGPGTFVALFDSALPGGPKTAAKRIRDYVQRKSKR